MKSILPLIKNKVKTVRRKVFESIGVYTFSKPYPGHETLLKYIKKDNGFFIQCGGNDGFTQDPTYYLEKVLGWKGIIVEPLLIAKTCQKNRPASVVYNAAAVSPSYSASTIAMIDVNLMSVIKNENEIDNEKEWVQAGERVQHITSREIIVPARTLRSIVDEYANSHPLPRIDLLVVDIEGYEYQALQGFDFDRYKPTYILVESHTEKRLTEIKNFLAQKHYKLLSPIVLQDYLFISE